MENLDKKGLGALSNGLGFESTLNKEASHGYEKDENAYVNDHEYKRQSPVANGAVIGLVPGLIGAGLGASLPVSSNRAKAVGALAGAALLGGVTGYTQYQLTRDMNNNYADNQEAYREHRRDEFRRDVLPELQAEESDYLDAVHFHPETERHIIGMHIDDYNSRMDALAGQYRALDPKGREHAYGEAMHSNRSPFASSTTKQAAIGSTLAPGAKTLAKALPSWKTNTALASTAIGGVVGYNSSTEGNKGTGALMGAAAGMGIGSTFRPQIKKGINYIKNLDVQGLKPQSNPMGGPANNRTASSFKKVQRDRNGNIIPWNSSKGW